MVQLRNLLQSAFVGLVGLTSVEASLSTAAKTHRPATRSVMPAACHTICDAGGQNTSCGGRIEWVQRHVDNWDRVVKVPDWDKELTCHQSRQKVINDCPICEECPHEACEFHVGDPVTALKYEFGKSTWHFGHITAVHASSKYEFGKYEVTFKTIGSTGSPVVIPSTHHVRKAEERPDPTPAPTPAPSLPIATHMARPSGAAPGKTMKLLDSSTMSAAKYSESWKLIDTKALGPHVLVGAVVGGVGLVGLSIFVMRKVAKGSQRSGLEVQVLE